MGIRYSYNMVLEGCVDLSGVLAEACIELGFWDNRTNLACSLTWLQVQAVERFMANREVDSYEYHTPLDLHKRSILVSWMANHTWEDKMEYT